MKLVLDTTLPPNAHERKTRQNADVYEEKVISWTACLNVIPESPNPHVTRLPKKTNSEATAGHFITTK